jgi:hypothetical protein
MCRAVVGHRRNLNDDVLRSWGREPSDNANRHLAPFARFQSFVVSVRKVFSPVIVARVNAERWRSKRLETAGIFQLPRIFGAGGISDAQ